MNNNNSQTCNYYYANFNFHLHEISLYSKTSTEITLHRTIILLIILVLYYPTI